MIDDQLTFSDHIAKTAWPCRFALFNIKKIRPFLLEHALQILVQALVLFRLVYCNALLAGLPASPIKPLQLIQNTAARYIFNEPKRMHVTPLFINLHWLPIAARIKIQSINVCLQNHHWLCTPLSKFIISDLCTLLNLRSASECRFIVTSQRGTKSLSQTFTLNVSSWWNDLPNTIRAAESLAIFKNQLKTHLFHLYLTL